MKWFLYSLAQNLINILPKQLSYKIYFFIQKKFGRLKQSDILTYLERAKTNYTLLRKYNVIPNTIFELGTGRTINTVLGFWFLGIKKIITVDVNPYLDEELVKKSIYLMLDNQKFITDLFSPEIEKETINEKLEQLQQLKDASLNEILCKLNIEYVTNQDVSHLSHISDNSIDLYYSNQVLEHIPRNQLIQILNESARITSPKGLHIHSIGLHDHFASIDKTIPKIHFLQFSEFWWNIIAGNKFMYHNRLRKSDYLDLFKNLNFKILDYSTTTDEKSLNLLKEGKIRLDKHFLKYTHQDLVTTSIKLISKRSPPQEVAFSESKEGKRQSLQK